MMLKNKTIYLCLALISASIISFEIIATRISSVIFVNNYAFIIISLSILGLGSGGIYSHYKIDAYTVDSSLKIIFRTVILIGISFLFFISAIIIFKITNPYIYFSLQIIPFFLAGIVFSQIFKIYADKSFSIYAADLIGAAVGAISSILILNSINAPNGIILLSVILFFAALILYRDNIAKSKFIITSLPIILLGVATMIFGNKEFLGRIPIGFYDEKDFYYVYPEAEKISHFDETRWSINGRSDLISYSNQSFVKQLFIDGAAGSPMYKFNGDVNNPGQILNELLVQQSTTIPFLFFNQEYKRDMLIIGPGGGKDVLIGLLTGVKGITGVEVNADFVDIVKKHKDFNGGIYNNFIDTKIIIDEARHFVKKTEDKFNIILMSLPSTEQLQNINNLSANENYLLTVEALKDYFHILNDNGSLVITIHNRWELIRLIVTTLYAFDEMGINNKEALNHFVILGSDYAPTIVIKKSPFGKNEIEEIDVTVRGFAGNIPQITFFPFSWDKIKNNQENRLLNVINRGPYSLAWLVENDKYDISPVMDDSPFFYKVNRGVPANYWQLFVSVIGITIVLIVTPFTKIKCKKNTKNEKKIIQIFLGLFLLLGIGFMILEISLFQKIILFLGSPTISLSILLSSILIGMGVGSYFGGQYYQNNLVKRIKITVLAIVIYGLILLMILPLILEQLIVYGIIVNSVVSVILIIPFGIVLGVPFPTLIYLLKINDLEKYIPWMYGVNGLMSVVGSIAAVVLSMIIGFNLTFISGLAVYLLILLMVLNKLDIKVSN